MGEFGEKFRKQREERGLTLDAVSNTTKISTRMLKALEDERFDQLPGGVFNKGFVRAYARQIGLDPEVAVGDYLDALRESQVQAHAIMPEFRPQRFEPAEPQSKPALSRTSSAPETAAGVAEPASGSGNHSQVKVERPAERLIRDLPPRKLIEERPAKPRLEPAVRIPWGMVAVGLLLVALLLALLSYHPRVSQRASLPPAKPPAELQSSTATPAPQAASASPAPPSTPFSAPSAASVPPEPATSSATSAPTTSASDSPAPSQVLPAATPEASPASKVVQPPKTAPIATENAAADTSAPIRPAATPASATTRVKTAELSLLIRAEENSWVSITADGNPVAQETLIAPAGKAVRATQEIVVHAGNAGGLVFELNGKPLPKQGESGEVRTFVFDSQGMRVIVPPVASTP